MARRPYWDAGFRWHIKRLRLGRDARQAARNGKARH
ncbi:hypothetical protein [Mesorhizobium atlanticum]